MANYWFYAAIDSNLDTLGNWFLSSDASVPAAHLPLVADAVTIGGSAVVDSGTCVAGTVDNEGGIGGGTLSGAVTNNNSIDAGTFAGVVTNNNTINGGTFSGEVTSNVDINDGTFSGAVTNNGNINGGTFNAPVNSAGGVVNGGTLNDDLTIIPSNLSNGAVINDRLSFDDGLTWLYSPNSPAVVAASKVLAGNTNLGVSGTLTLPAVGNVRSGTSYGVGGSGSTGTLNIASQPLLGVAKGFSY